MWYVSDGDCACYEIFCVQHFVHLFAMLVNMYVFIQHTMKNKRRNIAIACKMQSYISYKTEYFVPFPSKAENCILA